MAHSLIYEVLGLISAITLFVQNFFIKIVKKKVMHERSSFLLVSLLGMWLKLLLFTQIWRSTVGFS